MKSYLPKLQAAFPSKTEAEIELLMAGSRDLRKASGLSAHDHRRRGMELLFPSRIWHEWRDQRIRSVQECLEKRTQELMWIGSSNSNKSSDMADIALTLWWSKPEMTSIYVASPYETATETGVWAMILEQFDEAKGNNPSLPGKIRYSDNSIVHYERNPRSFIRIATVDQVGKLVGKKARNFSEGLLILILDELPAFTVAAARSLLGVMPNLVSVPNLLVIGAGNFASVTDALGVFCDPDERDIPEGYDGFDPDRHFRWRTKRDGLALRFDGLQSPNVKAGKDIYPFLTTNAYIAKLAGGPGGLQSPEAMRFVRSAPITSLDEFTITNGERMRAGGCFDQWTWTRDEITRLAFLDPGFGGDDCVLQKLQLGYEKTPTGRRQILALWEEPYLIPIKVGLKITGTDRMRDAEKQIVLAARKHCEANGIPPNHVGYDGSMRAQLAQAMATLWSTQVRALDSMGPPSTRPYTASARDAKGNPVTWNQKVDRFVSELWFAASSIIDSLQLRGLRLSPKAVHQLAQRRWQWIGKHKRAVETKQEYKDNLKARGMKMESPNEADAIVGGIEIARQLGFTLEGVAVSGGSLQMILGMIRDREHKAFLNSLRPNNQGLPPGGLHAMKRQSSISSGKLHR